MDNSKTDFSTKCEILSELWMDYRGDDEFKDFIDYNDIGLPLSYGITHSLVKPNESGIGLIEETWDLLLVGLGIEEDTGFETLDDILGIDEQ